MLLLKLVTERRLSFESKNIIFKNFFDINFRQLCYSAKSRDNSVIAKSISSQAMCWFISSYK